MINHILPKMLKSKLKPEAVKTFHELCEKMRSEEKGDTFPASVCTVFFLIHELFTYPQRIKNPTAPKKRKLVDAEGESSGIIRLNASDSQHAFIRFHSSTEDYITAYDAMVSQNKSVEPMVNVIGEMLAPKEFYVDFDNIRYKLPSIEKAIDICFKSFFLFGIKYPAACISFYQFLNCLFYKIKEEETSPLHVHKSLTKLIEMAECMCCARVVPLYFIDCIIELLIFVFYFFYFIFIIYIVDWKEPEPEPEADLDTYNLGSFKFFKIIFNFYF